MNQKNNIERYKDFELAINRQVVTMLDLPLIDPTLFTLINGTDAAVDDLWAAQHVNKIKNHWRGASAPSDPQAGMIWVDSDDNIFYGYTGAAWDAFYSVTSNPVSGESMHPFLLFGG